MKKIMVIFIVLVLNFIMLTTTVIAESIIVDERVGDIDTEDPLTMYNENYWFGNDRNPISLFNSSDAAEEAWLEALLGLVYDDNTVSLIDKTELYFGEGTEIHGLINFDPGFNWDYAIVKLSNEWYAFEDDFDDELLTTPEFDNAISHVSWFDPVTPVPEPATMLLFGSGLIALAGFGKKIRSKR